MKPTLVFLIAVALLILVPALVNAQSPPVPGKAPVPDIPAKSTPFSSPQAQIQASPQQTLAPQSYAPQYDVPQAAVVLRAPALYQVQRQIVVQASPVVAYAPVAYATADVGCVAQQAVVQRSFAQQSAFVNHGFQSAQINHGVVANAAVGRQPRVIKTKQKTKLRGRLR